MLKKLKKTVEKELTETRIKYPQTGSKERKKIKLSQVQTLVLQSIINKSKKFTRGVQKIPKGRTTFRKREGSSIEVIHNEEQKNFNNRGKQTEPNAAVGHNQHT